MKKRTQRIIIFVSLITVITLFAFFLKDILVPYIRMEIHNDLDGAKELLVSKGVLGFMTVVLVEALQMVVIFIPAEFIQISSGMSYPFYIAILLCDVGICLGATIIYVLVRVFGFDNEQFDKKEQMIDRLTAAATAKKHRGTVLMLYFLFIMPFIPFGAICYYGSRRGLRYGRYLLTVATGVIPSIVTSNLMGAATKYFIGNALPLPLLILIIALLSVLLFVILFVFLDRFFLKENDGTPDSIVYAAFFRLVNLLRRKKQRLILDDTGLKGRKAPYLVLCNHESFFDFYYVRQFLRDVNPAFVVNRHYVSIPVVRTLARKSGFIPKRMFHKDIVTPVKILRTLRSGYPVVIFPEARLSVTGRSYPILDRGGAFYQKLGVDLVLIKINGAYFAKPKWRSRFYRSDIRVGVERVITAEEARAMTPAELDDLIAATLRYDDAVDPINTYRQTDLAEGLENLLYRCADCGALYATKGVKNELVCSACGAAHRLNGNYRFDGEPETIGAYYDRIKEWERKELDHLKLEAPVDAVYFSDTGRFRTKDSGVCTLTKDGFTYRSDGDQSFSVGFDVLEALPFSCAAEFETYRQNTLFYFYPKENPRQAARWALLADLLKEKYDAEKGL